MRICYHESQRVMCPSIPGIGTIIKIFSGYELNDYIISVDFPSSPNTPHFFTRDGKEYKNQIVPTLYAIPYEEEEED